MRSFWENEANIARAGLYSTAGAMVADSVNRRNDRARAAHELTVLAEMSERTRLCEIAAQEQYAAAMAAAAETGDPLSNHMQTGICVDDYVVQLAIKQVLLSELRKMAPTHPLLTTGVREQVGRAALKAFNRLERPFLTADVPAKLTDETTLSQAIAGHDEAQRAARAKALREAEDARVAEVEANLQREAAEQQAAQLAQRVAQAEADRVATVAEKARRRAAFWASIKPWGKSA